MSEVAQRSFGSHVRSLLVTKITGTGLANNAVNTVKLDNIVGGEFVSPTNEVGHIIALWIRFTKSITAVAATTGGAMPGKLKRALLKDFHVRWANKELIDGGEMDGEDATMIAQLIARAPLLADPSDVADAENSTLDTGDVEILIPLASIFRDLFGREEDVGVPIAGFDTRQDPQAGLRFRNAALGDTMKGFLGVTNAAADFGAIEVRALVRYSKLPNLVPLHLKAASEEKTNFQLMPACNEEDGTHIVAAVYDAPSAATGIRSHSTYSGVTVRAGQDTFQAEATVGDLMDAFNTVDVAYPEVSLKPARTGIAHLPLIAVPADAAVLEQPHGPLSVKLTRTPAASRILQAGRGVADLATATRVNKALGNRYREAATPMVTGDAVRAARVAKVGVQKLIEKKAS